MPPPKKRRRWVWFLAISVLILVATGTILLVELKSRAERRLRDAIAATDVDDPLWRMEDVVAHREKVPDAENSALVVDRVLDLLPPNWPMDTPAQPGFPNPPPTSASEALEELSKTPLDQRLSNSHASQIRKALDDQREAVALARTLAKYPKGYRHIEFSPAFIDTLLPKTQATRNVARLLQMDAALRAHDGDLAGALESCQALVNCGRSLGDEPTLISNLVRMAIVGVAVNSTQRVLAQGTPPDEAMARLQALLADESRVPLTSYGLRGERAGMDSLIRRIRKGEIPLSTLTGSGPPVPMRPGSSASVPWGGPLFDNQRAIMLEWMTDAVQISRKPDAEQFALWEKWEARIVEHKKVWHAMFTETFPLLMTPAVSAASSAQARTHSEQASMSLLLAAERHRLKTGSWPSTVDEIDKSLLPAPLLDPFDGKPLKVLHRDQQFFVYSVGMNRVDDRGAYNVRLWMRGPYDVGCVAWDVDERRKPAPLPELPSKVFQVTPGEPDENP